MSAYGTVVSRYQGESPLPTTRWITRGKTIGPPVFIDTYHLTLKAARKCPGLVEYLHSVFAQVVEDGKTYPIEVAEGEVYSIEAFESYFFAADVIVGVLSTEGHNEAPDVDRQDGIEVVRGSQNPFEGSPENGQSPAWGELIVGFYYIKPNYPGRSSHICNAGFVVPPNHWNKGYGRALANSYLYYAPKLGYRASVFNLVYVNNAASIKLWETMGFTKAGFIPNAGRLKKEGGGEEFIDAIIFYKSFVGEQ